MDWASYNSIAYLLLYFISDGMPEQIRIGRAITPYLPSVILAVTTHMKKTYWARYNATHTSCILLVTVCIICSRHCATPRSLPPLTVCIVTGRTLPICWRCWCQNLLRREFGGGDAAELNLPPPLLPPVLVGPLGQMIRRGEPGSFF